MFPSIVSDYQCSLIRVIFLICTRTVVIIKFEITGNTNLIFVKFHVPTLPGLNCYSFILSRQIKLPNDTRIETSFPLDP